MTRSKRRARPKNPSSRNTFVGFGNAREWSQFRKRYPKFVDRFPNIVTAIETAFQREGSTTETLDRVIFFGGRLCAEDFLEIVLLCGNGYGVAALKILRGMYERAVTVRYLKSNPEFTDDFLDFHWVQQHRVTAAIERTFGKDALRRDQVADAEANYNNVKKRFVVTTCEKCGSQNLNFTWSKLDFVSQARAAGPIGDLIALGYYLPTRHAHSTAGAILSRLKMSDDGTIYFDGGPQYQEVDIALITAHNILLNILDLQKDHFRLDRLDEPLQQCFSDFAEVWER